MQPSTICFVASKSGGHIIPCLALAEQYKKQNPSLKTALICGADALDATIAQSANIMDDTFQVSLKPFAKNKPWLWPAFIASVLKAFVRSRKILRYIRAERLVSTGGLIAIPAALAARSLRIPVELYELNAVPGKAIAALTPLASKINVCFADAQRFFNKPCQYVAYPLRKQQHYTMNTARERLAIKEHLPTIFIMGGSQGSRFINQQWRLWILDNLEQAQRLHIIHQTGSNDSFDWHNFYAVHAIKAHLFAFTHDMSLYYAAANLVVCRAGAGTLFELKACGIPALVIPLAKRINDHQVANARSLATITPTLYVLEQEELEQNPHLFWQALSMMLLSAIPQAVDQAHRHNC